MIVPGSVTAGHLKANEFVFNHTFSAHTLNPNLRSLAIAGGWDGVKPLNATFTVNSGIYLYSADTSTPALDTGTPFPAGSSIKLINNGVIIGRGGAGGNSYNYAGGPVGYAGGNGGPALRAQAAIKITNNGSIGGGGGGGGGTANRDVGAGGGGGQGGAAGGVVTYSAAHLSVNGNPSTLSAPAAGGNATYSWQVANGGAGGGIGATGGVGNCNVDTSSFGAGGAPGVATIGNANITWVVSGSIYGSLT